MKISKSLLIPDNIANNKQARKEFKELQKTAIELGLKSKVPLKKKDFLKWYDGSKQYANSDYYFYWLQEIKKFYKKVGKKAVKKAEKHKFDTPRTRKEIVNLPNQSVVNQLKVYSGYLTTLGHYADDEYYNNELTKAETRKLNIEKDTQYIELFGKRYKEVRQAGRSATLKDFGGSRLKLCYNNYLIALSKLGYYKTLTYVSNMPLEKWWEIYRNNYEIVQDVFRYNAFTPYNDEYYLSVFAEDESRIEGLNDDYDSWDF